jgi:hypothetical protein
VEAKRAELEAQLKAIDLFSPLASRMLVRVRGAGRTGLMVLLAELTRRLGDSGRCSLWISWEPMPSQKGELATFVREMGIDDFSSIPGRRSRVVTTSPASFARAPAAPARS